MEKSWQWIPSPDRIAIIRHKEQFEIGAVYRMVLKKGLPGTAGNLGMADTYAFSFSTVNVFKYTGSRIMHTTPDLIWDLRPKFYFSNPVRMKDFVVHFHSEPKIKFAEWCKEGTHASAEIVPDFELQAANTYTIILDPDLQDEFGNRLGEEVKILLIVGNWLPRAIITPGFGIIESYMKHQYPLFCMNIGRIGLKMKGMAPDSIIPYFNYGYGWVYTRPLPVPEAFWSVNRIWDIKSPLNKGYTLPVETDEAANLDKQSTVLLLLDCLEENLSANNWYFGSRRYQSAMLQITGMGISAKFSPYSNLVFVTRLLDSVPLPKAKVEIRDKENRVLWTGLTDNNGVCITPGWKKLGLSIDPENPWQKPMQWVFVYRGINFAFINSEWESGIFPWRFHVNYDWYNAPQDMAGYVYTEKGIYRPGETVHIKCCVREKEDRAWNIPSGCTMVMRITDSRGEEFLKRKVNLSGFGSFSEDVKIPQAAALGYYTIKIRFPKEKPGEQEKPWDDWREANYVAGTFRVAEYRPAQFEVNARVSKDSYVFGDTASGKIEGRYLFGASMSGCNVRWNIFRNRSYYEPPGHKGYYFQGNWWTDEGSGAREGLITQGSGVLDSLGTVDVNFRLDGRNYSGTARYMLEGTVQDLDRQQITGRAGTTVHRGTYYIGVKPSSTFLEKGDPVKLQIIACDINGETIAGRELRLNLVHSEWCSTYRAEVGGRYHWVTEKKDTIEDTRFITTALIPAEVDLKPDSIGYYIVRVEGNDERGNPVKSGCYFYITGSGYTAWERNNDDIIELVADSQKYKPGDTAKVLVKSPYESCSALVTLEREGIIDNWVTKLYGSADRIEIKLTEDHLPNVFVSVLLLQGRAGEKKLSEEGEDVGKPSFKIGYANLLVDPGTKHLQIDVKTNRKDYRPGDEVRAEVKVKDALGRGIESEISLAAVDEGVLSLIGYRTPDPFPAFYGPRPLSVKTVEMRAGIVGQRNYGEKGEDRGGGGGLGMAGFDIRKKFEACAYWNPSIITDGSGSAAVKFRLPDNLTTFRIMAVAGTKDSLFGSGDSKIKTNKPLMLRPAFPRFARLGDEFEAGAVVHNYTGKGGTVTLAVSAEGIKLKSGAVRTFYLANNEGAEFRYPFGADRIGRAVFTFKAVLDSEKDAVSISIPLNLPKPTESVGLFGSTTGEQREWIEIPEDFIPGVGGGTFTAASTAMVDLAKCSEYLFNYPYGCLEQRLSRVLPMILFGKVVDAFKLPGLVERDYHQVIQEDLNKMVSFQLPNGGMAAWVDSAYDNPYISAYALFAMHKARQEGYRVDERMMQKTKDYLINVLRNKANRSYYPYSRVCWNYTDCFILQALATCGIYEPALAEYLYNYRSELPYFALAMLWKAIVIGKGNQNMAQVLRQMIDNGMKIDSTTAHFEEPDREGLGWVFHSNTRTTAAVLQAFLEMDKAHPAAEKMARWLLQARKRGVWRSTQENLYVFWALATYFERYESETPDFTAGIKVEQKEMLSDIFKGRSLKTNRKIIPLENFTKGKTLPMLYTCKGKGRFYFGTWLTYAPKKEIPAKDEGFSVQRLVETMDGKPADLAKVKAGTMLRIRIIVSTTRDRNYVVVDDPIPGGFEPVDTTLKTESRLEGFQSRSEDRFGNRRWWGSFNRSELYDDRVVIFADYMNAGVHNYSYLVRATTYGGFRAPATKAEEMYAPEVFGYGTAYNVTIVK